MDFQGLRGLLSRGGAALLAAGVAAASSAAVSGGGAAAGALFRIVSAFALAVAAEMVNLKDSRIIIRCRSMKKCGTVTQPFHFDKRIKFHSTHFVIRKLDLLPL